MKDALIDTETPLFLHITAAMETVKSSLVDVLSKADDEERQRFENDIAKFKEREVIFYNIILSQLTERFGPSNAEAFYLYFDIDETIAHNNRGLTWIDKEEIRPALSVVLQDIQAAYPNVHFGICSSRAQRFIDEFIQTYPEFGFEVWYSSREFNPQYHPLDNSWGINCSMGHYNKALAMIEIRGDHPNAILVDDIIEQPFIDKKMGIPVKEASFRGYPYPEV